jgi:hypothetical protein
MNRRKSIASFAFVVGASASIGIAGLATPALAGGNGIANRSFVQTNLVSDIPGLATHTDPNLRNPWGTATKAWPW